jgi:uncharacterized protein (DUF486 family)
MTTEKELRKRLASLEDAYHSAMKDLKKSKLPAFNEYGVMISESLIVADDRLAENDLSIQELMILQRHITMTVQHVFSSQIMRQAVYLRKTNKTPHP